MTMIPAIIRYTDDMLHALILLQLLDIATTHYALPLRIGTEANPVLRKLFDRRGHEPGQRIHAEQLTN